MRPHIDNKKGSGGSDSPNHSVIPTVTTPILLHNSAKSAAKQLFEPNWAANWGWEQEKLKKGGKNQPFAPQKADKGAK